MIGNGGHAKQLIAEGCDPNARLIAIGSNRDRKKEAEAHAGFGGRWDTFISFGARFYTPIERCLGEGSQVLSGAIVGAGATVGRHVIINHHAVVEHDATVGDFAHIAPGAKVLGGAKVGVGVLVGAGAVVLPNAIVPDWAIIRACSVWPSDYGKGKRKLKYQ